MKNRINHFLKVYNEWLSIPLAILLYLMAPSFYRIVDPTAGAFDPGYLHSILFAIIAVNFASGIAWFMFRFNFPKMYRFWDDEMEDVLITGESNRFKAVNIALMIYILFFSSILLVILGVINTL